MNTKHFLPILALALSTAVLAAPPKKTFRETWKAAAKDMLPALQIKQCKNVPVKDGNRVLIECSLKIGNSMLTVEGTKTATTGAWLMLDASRLEQPSDLMRAGGLLIRTGRGGSMSGNYLQFSLETFQQSKAQGWKEACSRDEINGAKFCVSSDDGRIFHLTLGQ
jgi:hypothetical protein